MGYLFLLLAIFGELLGTSLLKASEGFSVLIPTIASAIAYMACLYFLALSMKTVNLNVAYAIWCGIGMVLTTIIAILIWKEPVNLASFLGISLILAGTVILSMYGAGR